MALTSRRVVITGLGLLTPIGLDPDSFWAALVAGKSGVRPLSQPGAAELPVRIAGEMAAFDAKKILSGKEERKSLKMMARTVQLGVACAKLAFADAAVDRAKLDSTRFGVEVGAALIPTDLDDLATASALSGSGPGGVNLQKWGAEGVREVQPLWMLKYLPNMVACHVSILLDAQGPNNSITETDVAGILALGEAARIIVRDDADFFLVGSSDSKVTPLSLVRQCTFASLSRRNDAPEKACRPFARDRDGLVIGEGAGMMAVEELEHARRRGAKIYGEVVGFGAAFDRKRDGAGLARAVRVALKQAGIGPEAVDHVNACGLGTRETDAWEARGLGAVFGTAVPVFAAKGYFGNLSAAAGPVELAASLLAFRHGVVPRTLNCDDPDPACPIAVLREPKPVTKPYFVKVSLTDVGQCAAAVVKKWDGNA